MKQKRENRLGQTAGSDPRQKPATSGCFIVPQPAGPRKLSRWADFRWLQKSGLLGVFFEAGTPCDRRDRVRREAKFALAFANLTSELDQGFLTDRSAAEYLQAELSDGELGTYGAAFLSEGDTSPRVHEARYALAATALDREARKKVALFRQAGGGA